MNSLRVRLILGFSLVALVPVLVVMLVMGARIQATVRAQSGERLGSALGVLRAQLGAESGRIAGKLELLASDAELKRLYLVQSESDAGLREHLANQQYLLDLDYLGVTDTTGALVADGAMAPNARLLPGREPVAIGSLAAPRDSGVALASLAGARAIALDGAATIRYRDELVGRVRGGVLLDSLRLAELRATSGVDLALWDAAGGVVASTTAGVAAVGPGDSLDRRVLLGGRAHLARTEAFALGGELPVRVTGFVSTAAAEETLAALRTTSLLLALLAVGIAVALGLVWSRQISRPVERLAEFSKRISRGEWDEPLAIESLREVRTLVEALERMRADLRGYRERLVASERQAAYGQMARKVAHEIKNPLTPIAVSVADLKRSYEQQRPDFPQILDQAVRTIDEEVQSLKRLLHEFSEFGRFPHPQLAPFDVNDLLSDFRALFAREVSEGRLALDAPAGALVLRADRGQLRQALLNLVQNGLDATAPAGHVVVSARRVDGAEPGERPAGSAPPARTGRRFDLVQITVTDDGPGLTPEQRAQLFVPGFTTKAHGSGLGLTIVERIVTEHGGTITVDSAPGSGVAFTIRLPAEPSEDS